MPQGNVRRKHLLWISTPGYYKRVSKFGWHLFPFFLSHEISVSILVKRVVMWISPQTRVTRCATANPKIMIQDSVDMAFYYTPKTGRWSILPWACIDALSA